MLLMFIFLTTAILTKCACMHGNVPFFFNILFCTFHPMKHYMHKTTQAEMASVHKGQYIMLYIVKSKVDKSFISSTMFHILFSAQQEQLSI